MRTHWILGLLLVSLRQGVWAETPRFVSAAPLVDPAPLTFRSSPADLPDGLPDAPDPGPAWVGSSSAPFLKTPTESASTPAQDTSAPAKPRLAQQPKRILGIMPNYRSVGNDVTPPRPSFRTNFTVATHQALDYSSFLFLGMTSLVAEATNAHPALGKGADGYWAYLWRGFLDKTDNTYLSAFVLPSILHEDTRFYALGHGSVTHRVLYVISRQAVARTYDGHPTPNIASLGGKAATQAISRYYYPPSAATFSVLATKFGYAVARDVGFTMFREFYPDMRDAALRKHERTLRERQARRQP